MDLYVDSLDGYKLKADFDVTAPPGEDDTDYDAYYYLRVDVLATVPDSGYDDLVGAGH